MNITVDIALNNVWVLVCAALVFIMHAGFACVEAGMTQSKNTANIIMKNFMTIAIGSLCYYIIGYSLMYGTSLAALSASLSSAFWARAAAYRSMFSGSFRPCSLQLARRSCRVPWQNA